MRAIPFTLNLISLAILFALPSGVGAAIYLNEISRPSKINFFLRRTIQNLAAVPSIIFGLVGLVVFSRLLGFGLSLLTGSLTLAMMILPMIVVTSEEALLAVPKGFRDGALAVGATRWQTVRHHVLPNAIPGIATGTILSIARALGETAPILFVASIFSKTAPSGILDGFMALPIQIFFNDCGIYFLLLFKIRKLSNSKNVFFSEVFGHGRPWPNLFPLKTLYSFFN